jgi:hypothetical protein
MSGEAEAVAALTLLVAVCEQALVRVEELDPPADPALLDAAERLRDIASAELTFGRFRRETHRVDTATPQDRHASS